MGVTWLLGVGFSAASTFFGTFGKVLMKHSHNAKCRKSFFVGMFFVLILNPGLTLVALAFAPQSILAPMAGLAIVWNTLLASRFLKERVFCRDYIASLMLGAGCVLVTVGGPHETPDYTREQLDGFFSDGVFLIYVFILFTWIASLYVALFWSQSSISDPLGRAKVTAIKKKTHRFSYGALAGTIGGIQFFGKAGMESLKQGKSAWSHAETYIFFLATATAAATGLYYLNKGLRYYDAVTVVSMYEAFLVFNGSLSGLIFFHEFDEFSDSPTRLLLYFGGLLTSFGGIGLLGTRPSGTDGVAEKRDESGSALVLDPLSEGGEVELGLWDSRHDGGPEDPSKVALLAEEEEA